MRGRPRRVKGEGSIWQRKDGRWGGAVYVTVEGRKKRRTITRNTSEEVVAEKKRLEKAGKAASGKSTFGEFLDEWLAEVKNSIRPKTYESYEAVVRLHLKPVIGRVKLVKLEPKHINDAVNAARNAGLSSSSYAYVRTVARIALGRAMKLGKVTENAAKLALPVTVEQKEEQPFSDAEFAAFMSAIEGHRLEPLYQLAIVLGPRKGELLGLQWSDLMERQNDDGTVTTWIRIQRQVQRVAGRLRVVPVKTKRSQRAVTLPPTLAELLKRHKTNQLRERLKAGKEWQNTGHIFTTRYGSLIDPRSLLRNHYYLQRVAGISPRRSFHALRHETATAMLAANVPLKAISATLGHSSERFTSEKYARMVPSLEAKVTAVASARLKKK